MKFKIQISNNDKEITLPIVSRVNPLGYDDNIQNLVDAETNNSINTVTDMETRRIKLGQPVAIFTFNFWNGSSYVNKIAPLEFTATTYLNTPPLTNSFYVAQVYDGYQEETQNKRHTGYYNGYDFSITDLDSEYILNITNEFTDIYLPKWYLDSMSGMTTNCYIKFLFYSAKSGKFYTFNNGTSTDTDQKKLYYTIQVNPNTLTYTYPVGGNISMNEITNASYNALVNNTVPSFPIQKTTFPSGNTFTSSGQYVNQ